MRVSVPAAATAAFLLSVCMSASAADYSGFWKTVCTNAFGVSIKPEGDQLYGIRFCTPSGCKPWKPKTAIDGDALYRLVDANTLDIGGVRYKRCMAETEPKLEWAKAESPAPAQPSVGQTPIPQNVEAGDYAFAPAKPRAPGERLNPLWFGTWKSEDGTSTVTISATRMVHDYSFKDYQGHLRTRNLEFEWRDDTDDGEAFGYLADRISPEKIAERYEEAVRQFKEDPTEWVLSDPTAARRAIAAISPGVYRVVRSYWGGDCDGWDYILDKDRMLEFVDCKYAFQVVLYNRVK